MFQEASTGIYLPRLSGGGPTGESKLLVINMSTQETEIQKEDGSRGVGALIDYNRRLREQMTELSGTHREEVRGLKGEIKALQGQVAEQQKAFQHDLQEKDREQKVQDNQNQQLLEKIRILTSELSSSREKSSQLEAELAKSQSRAGSLDKLKQSLLGQHRDSKSKLGELQSICTEQEEAIEDLMTERDQLMNELEDFKDSNQQLRTLEREKAELARALQEKTAEFDAQTAKVEELKGRAKASEIAKSQAEEQRASAADSLNLLEEKLLEMTTEQEELLAKLDFLKDSAQRISVLERENAKLEAEMKQQAEDVAVSRRYIQEAEGRMAENDRLKALAKQKTEETAEAKRKQEIAEKEAFESRRKLLASYTEQESKQIIIDNLDKARTQIQSLESELKSAATTIADWERKYEKLEQDTLFSSSRDSLRASLGKIAKRRSGDK